MGAIRLDGTPRMKAAWTLRDLLPFAALYASFGATLGLLGSGAPLVFRARGMPLAEIGLIQTIYLPIGLTFLWAPLLDRLRLPGLPLRVGWIVMAQVATIALLIALALVADGPIVWLFVLAVAISIGAATMDVALEALVVETVPRDQRPPITTAKLCGSSFGSMVGVSLATLFTTILSLSQSLVVVAGLDVLLLLPILWYPERERRLPMPDGSRQAASLARLLPIAKNALALGFYFAAGIMLDNLSNLVLLDLHVSLPVVGLLTGSVATAIGIGMTLLSGVLTMRVATPRLVTVLAAGAILSGLLLALATATGSAWLGIGAAILNTTCAAGLGVPVFNMIYRWAEGAQAATDYSLLFGFAFMASLPARIGTPALAGAIGWPNYFVLGALLYAAAVALLLQAMRRTPTRVVAAVA
jgi:PAT family beta-lactamase induction signal transducer AmpG